MTVPDSVESKAAVPQGAPAPAPAAPMSADPTRKNVLILALCVALGMSGNGIVLAVGALAGAVMLVDDGWATLPLAVMFTATMVTTIPASMLMGRVGRRAGFSIGALTGFCGASLAAFAIFANSFPLFVAASVPIGMFNAFAQFYRLAAADTASDAFRPRAISLVMAGGVLAALLGPTLAKWSYDLFAPVLFAGGYAVIAVLTLLSLALLQFVEIPRPSAADRRESGRPLGQILRQPKFITAAVSAAAGYGTMSLVMTATPLAMVACGFSFHDSATVIQWHALAMFAPAFFTGNLIQRFGALNVILVGALLNAGCLAVALSGIAFEQFLGALVLLGLGWNFMFIGGTSLLTETHTPAERAKTQAVNDFAVFTTVALASASSGVLHSRIGWEAVNLGMALPLLIAMAAVILLKLRTRTLAS